MKALLVLINICLWLGYNVIAQNQKAMLQEIAEENKETVEALVLYPEEVRNSIFKACQYPEVLVKMDQVQNNNRKKFRTLIQDYSQEKQKEFYDVTRYSELLEELVMKGPLSKEEIKSLVKDYPEEIHETAIQYGRREYDKLKEIHNLQEEAQQAYLNIMKPYAANVKDVFNALVAEPDVLSILTGNIKMAILVGDIYKNDPLWLVKTADSLHLEVARKNAEELQDWKKELASDPEALAEMQQAARNFAQDNGYDPEENPETKTEIIYRPYPYWFGYPYWYADPWWYPYPYWYHTGFYIDTGGTFVVVGLPSFYYSVWFFNTPRRYHYLHRHYWNFYDRHPRSGSGLVIGMRTSRTRIQGVDRGISRRQDYPIDRSRTDRQRTGSVNRDRNQPTTGRPGTRIRSSRTPQRTVQRERANDYHRQRWDNSRSQRRSPQRSQPTTRKRSRNN